MLGDMRTLVRFFESTPLALLAPRDGMAGGDVRWALSSPDHSTTVLYAPRGTGKLVARDLLAGKLMARWVDAASGATLSAELHHAGGDLRLTRPRGFGEEIAVALVREGALRTSTR